MDRSLRDLLLADAEPETNEEKLFIMWKRTHRKQNQRRLLSWLLSLTAVGVIVAGVLVGTLVLRAHSNGAHADSNLETMTRSEMLASILPMEPMYKMAVNMNQMSQAPGSTAQQATGVGQPVATPPAAATSCLNSATPPLCYSPQQIYQAYDIQSLLNAGTNGTGKTIAIIDAFQDPTVQPDLNLFDQQFGLPNTTVNVMAPNGLTPFNPNDPAQTGFAGEIGLDVEWAHAIAPGATIDLILGNVQQETLQGEISALLQATQFAVQNKIGDVISQSWGAGESCVGANAIQQAHQIFTQAQAQGQTVFASAGDSGAAVVQCDANGNPVTEAQGVNYPESDPMVTSVGGTTLALNNNNYGSEVTWNDSAQGDGATGGGFSTIFAQPTYQQGIVQNNMRATADVSFDADPLTGVPVVSSEIMPGQTVLIPIGGTSVGSPVWAGVTALIDQAQGADVGFLNPALYQISQSNTYGQAFHDITTGNNTFTFQNANGQVQTVNGFPAMTGWDNPTGVGTPDVANLAQVLPQFLQGNNGAGT